MNRKTAKILNDFNSRLFERVPLDPKYRRKRSFNIRGRFSGRPIDTTIEVSASGKALKRFYKTLAHRERAAFKRALKKVLAS